MAALETCGFSEYISPGMGERIPGGYKTLELPSLTVVAREDFLADIESALATGTLYDFARGRPDVLAFKGRGDALAFRALSSGETIVVRRSRHGGLLAPLTGEIFLRPGRAPHELRTAIALQERGVATAQVLGHVRYWTAWAFCRTDVVTRFIPDARDMATLLRDERNPEFRIAALRATVTLMSKLAGARALHPDLNLRNVLISGDAASATAWVLDVDRVELDRASGLEVSRANRKRFMRSANKLQRLEQKVLLSADERALLNSAAQARP